MVSIYLHIKTWINKVGSSCCVRKKLSQKSDMHKKNFHNFLFFFMKMVLNCQYGWLWKVWRNIVWNGKSWRKFWSSTELFPSQMQIFVDVMWMEVTWETFWSGMVLKCKQFFWMLGEWYVVSGHICPKFFQSCLILPLLLKFLQKSIVCRRS